MKEETFAEWRPDWTPAEQKQVDEAASYLRDQVSLLKVLREQLGLSQLELSDILGTSQSNVSKIETKADPRISVIRKLIEHQGGRLKIVAEFPDKALELQL
ncbi:helix-turn-helix transcriptional regulator [Caulobacter sp.]|uniref:helix-turn-helix domain-containing protein n=1 Tax=Caulobacter sp. TaxID=78 RepID=UPI001B114961|nr:helix-turn-helix transcriptional regulator [Caulobacter sp.]MBO9546683.1 helix-turn-helix transcriptional regulator [Caulobacter sp.]